MPTAAQGQPQPSAKGRGLWHLSQTSFRELERAIVQLRDEDAGRVTVGMSTYFASRLLAARLMTFITMHPRIGLRPQPLVKLVDLGSLNIDRAIRWGNGAWSDLVIERLFSCPAFPTAGASIAARVARSGIEAALSDAKLLQDRDESSAWAHWHEAAGLQYRRSRDDLVIPDPNVRVQAVMDGQGIALNDELVAAEIAAGKLFSTSDVALRDYGYFLAYPAGALENPSARAFRDWIMTESENAFG